MGAGTLWTGNLGSAVRMLMAYMLMAYRPDPCRNHRVHSGGKGRRRTGSLRPRTTFRLAFLNLPVVSCVKGEGGGAFIHETGSYEENIHPDRR